MLYFNNNLTDKAWPRSKFPSRYCKITGWVGSSGVWAWEGRSNSLFFFWWWCWYSTATVHSQSQDSLISNPQWGLGKWFKSLWKQFFSPLKLNILTQLRAAPRVLQAGGWRGKSSHLAQVQVHLPPAMPQNCILFTEERLQIALISFPLLSSFTPAILASQSSTTTFFDHQPKTAKIFFRTQIPDVMSWKMIFHSFCCSGTTALFYAPTPASSSFSWFFHTNMSFWDTLFMFLWSIAWKHIGKNIACNNVVS